MVRHKVGLSFQLLLWERKVLIPGFTFSEWGKRIQGKRLFFLYSSALCTAMPGAELGSLGIRMSLPSRCLAIHPHSHHLSWLQTQSLETDERECCTNEWKKGVLWISEPRAEVLAKREPQLRRLWVLWSLPQLPWPDNSSKWKLTYVHKHLCVPSVFNSPRVHFSISFLVTNGVIHVILANETKG